jgi:hypothetical protein
MLLSKSASTRGSETEVGIVEIALIPRAQTSMAHSAKLVWLFIESALIIRLPRGSYSLGWRTPRSELLSEVVPKLRIGASR